MGRLQGRHELVVVSILQGISKGIKVTDIPDKRYFRPDEVAKILEQPLRTIYFWLQHDKIKHLHFGKRVKITREEVEKISERGI